MHQFAARFGILGLVVGLVACTAPGATSTATQTIVPTATVAETFEPPRSDFAQTAITTR